MINLKYCSFKSKALSAKVRPLYILQKELEKSCSNEKMFSTERRLYRKKLSFLEKEIKIFNEERGCYDEYRETSKMLKNCAKYHKCNFKYRLKCIQEKYNFGDKIEVTLNDLERECGPGFVYFAYGV